jgi:hypothetical protein
MGKYPYFPKVQSTWNKKQKLNDISIKEITTPSNPDTDYEKIYFKSDGELYKLNSSGVESVVGGSSGGVVPAIMPQDTTALNHTYSTTTTASTGESQPVTVTAQGLGSASGSIPTNNSQQIYNLGGFTGAGATSTGTVTYTLSMTGDKIYTASINFLNSSGVIVFTHYFGSMYAWAGGVKTHTFTDIPDIASWYFTARNPSSAFSFSISSSSWTGTANNPRSPTEMNSATGDGVTSNDYYASASTVSPYIKTDFGSSTRVGSIAIMPRVQNTETIFVIQTSDDDITYTTNRTILASKLTNWQYNYVKLTPVQARYVKVLGTSGVATIISFDEVKVKNGITDTTFLDAHYHQDISTTDTSLTLAGD